MIDDPVSDRRILSVRCISPAPALTIRRTLMIAFALVGLLPALVLGLLAFERSRAALHREIGRAVERAAADVAADVDAVMRERLLNAVTWHHLEVMQDLRLGDVDKRLSAFLANMKDRYADAYRHLHAIDPAGSIIASSDPLALGRSIPSAGAQRRLGPPDDHVRFELPTWPRPGQVQLRIRSTVASRFTPGDIGELVMDLDPASLEHLLDRMSSPQRQALLLDAGGRLIAASAGLRGAGLLPGHSARQDGATQLQPATLRLAETVLGGPVIQGAALTGLGHAALARDWQTWVLHSRDAALAPVRKMAAYFLILLAAVGLATLLVARGVASRIARPVTALTDYTRAYLDPGGPPSPPPPASGELGELSRSFVGLVGDLQTSQDTLVKASRLAALGEVTALMAHEIRTPLGILRSGAQMLAAETGLSAEGRELLGIIETETARLNRLVATMLDNARTQPPRRRAQDLCTLVRHAATLMAIATRKQEVQIRLDLPASPLIVSCDAEQITQVLLNLIVNALQAMPGGGDIRIGLRPEPDRVWVDVDDQGPGITDADRERLFEPFVSRRQGGFGLGLAVVRQIVRGHGGEARAGAAPGGGARMSFWLSMSEETGS